MQVGHLAAWESRMHAAPVDQQCIHTSSLGTSDIVVDRVANMQGLFRRRAEPSQGFTTQIDPKISEIAWA